MAASWHGLLADLAVVAMFVFIWMFLQGWIAGLSGTVRSLAFGALMGFGAVSTMLVPLEVGAGIHFDLRSSLISLSALFGGPLAGALAAGMAAIYRAYVGGKGAFSGCCGILIAFLVGAAAHALLRRRRPGNRDIVSMSAVVAAGTILSLLALPANVRWTIMADFALPFALLTFLSTAMAGMAMLLETRRREMADANAVLRSVFMALPDCLNVKDLSGRFIAANPATARLMKVPTADDLVGKTDFDFYPQAIAERFRKDEEKAIADGSPITMEQCVTRPGGSSVWLWSLKAVLHDEKTGAPIGLITHNRDITDWRGVEQELATTQQRLADALEHMADALVMFDKDQRLVFCNAQYHAMFAGIADLGVPGTPFRDILAASVQRGQQSIGAESLEAWLDQRCSILSRPDDRSIHLTDGRWIEARSRPTSDGGALIVFSDVTDRKRADAALARLNDTLAALASTDGLTGLVNRRMFDLGLDREFARARRDGTPLSLLLIDVDKFKAYNDSYGHPEGDECLRRISRCLSDGLKRPGDLVARYGGEEFAAILPDTGAEAAQAIADRLRLAVRAEAIPHRAYERGVVTVSVGVATARLIHPGERCGDLVRAADEALYNAKAAGRDRVRAFRPADPNDMVRRIELAG